MISFNKKQFAEPVAEVKNFGAQVLLSGVMKDPFDDGYYYEGDWD